MLVLKRHLNQRIIIGDSIVITVVETHDGQMKLGIEAPSDLTVHREEVYRRVSDARWLDALDAAKGRRGHRV